MWLRLWFGENGLFSGSILSMKPSRSAIVEENFRITKRWVKDVAKYWRNDRWKKCEGVKKRSWPSQRGFGKVIWYNVHNQHMLVVFSSGGVEICSTNETTDNGGNCEVWIFLWYFREKVVKMVVMMEGVIQISFTRALRWTPLYLLKKYKCVTLLGW